MKKEKECNKSRVKFNEKCAKEVTKKPNGGKKRKQNSEKFTFFFSRNKYLQGLTVFYLGGTPPDGCVRGGSLIGRWSPRPSLSRAAGTCDLQEGRGTAGTRTPPAPGAEFEKLLVSKVME